MEEYVFSQDELGTKAYTIYKNHRIIFWISDEHRIFASHYERKDATKYEVGNTKEEVKEFLVEYEASIAK